MTTRRTATPLHHLTLGATHRPMDFFVHHVGTGRVTLDAPYQRGSVWTEDQRIALIMSMLRGLPMGLITINRRPYAEGQPMYAVIDGKQRISTAIAWTNDEFAVPASWFEDIEVKRTELTDDGDYVRFSGLSDRMRRFFDSNIAFPCSEAQVSTIDQEAEIYGLVNGAGTPQTITDMARAATIAQED